MGWWNRIYDGAKNILGKAVGAGKWIQGMRDKVVDVVGKVKRIPIIGSALDAGINAVMSTPIGSAIRTANNVLNAGVDAGDMALKAMEAREKDGGPPPLQQLKEIGSAALQKVKDGYNQPTQPTEQDKRLDAIKQT